MSRLSDRERLIEIFKADDEYTASNQAYPHYILQVILDMRRGFAMPDGYVAPPPFGESTTDDQDASDATEGERTT